VFAREVTEAQVRKIVWDGGVLSGRMMLGTKSKSNCEQPRLKKVGAKATTTSHKWPSTSKYAQGPLSLVSTFLILLFNADIAYLWIVWSEEILLFLRHLDDFVYILEILSLHKDRSRKKRHG
jgi:hypothetical protein